MKQIFKHADYVSMGIRIYVAKWYCSVSGSFIFWSGHFSFGKFKRKK